MSNILAGVGRGQLSVLEERVRARRAVFHRYREGLGDIAALEWMPEPEWSYSTHWLSTCTLRGGKVSAQDLVKRLAGEMIEARPIWKPMHLQPVFAACEYIPHGNASVSDEIFENGICLPSGSNLSEDNIDRVIAAVRAVLT
jgi:dTDP-4-amino-4,6-dideoxygalactose transaminase